MTSSVSDLLPCGCPRTRAGEAAAGAFRVRFGAYVPGCRAGVHHHDEARIVLPLHDGLETSQGAHRLAPRAGEAVYRPAGEAHVDRYARRVDCVALLLPAATPVPRGAFVAGDATIAGLARALAREAAADDVAAPLVREGLALVASTLVLQQRTGVERGVPAWLGRVSEQLAAATDVAPSLATLAASVDRDPAHVAATFRRVHGMTVGVALRRMRLARARAWLDRRGDVGAEIDTRHRIGASEAEASGGHARHDREAHDLAAIAQACGFADQSHFTRQFRVLFGVTPGAYRRRQRDGAVTSAA